MRILLVGLSLAWCAPGCASRHGPGPDTALAASLGISSDDLSAIMREVDRHHPLVVVKFQQDSDGAIDVFLGDQPAAKSGPEIGLRKINGRWSIDPRLPSVWIVTKQ